MVCTRFALLGFIAALTLSTPLAALAACSDISPCPSGQACNASGVCEVISGGGGGELLNPLGTGYSLPALLRAILEFVVRIGAVVVVLMLVYVGFLFVTAQGNETKLSAAKSGLLWTVVGALILLGAQAIASGIEATVRALSTGT